MSRDYVEVSLPPPVARELTYGVPDELVDDMQPGALVLVPVMLIQQLHWNLLEI